MQINIALAGNDLLPLTANYDDVLKLALQVDKQTETLHSGHIVYGPGQPGVRKNAGLRLDIKQPELDVADWQMLIGDHQAEQAFNAPKLDRVNVDLAQLKWGRQRLGKLTLDLKRLDQYWQGSLSSPLARGGIRLPDASVADNKIMLQMNYLDLTRIAGLDLPVSSINSERIPLISIVSDRLLWRGVDLGRLELETERTSQGVHFDKIMLSGRDGLIELTADWLRSGDENATELRGRLISADFGRFLGELGYNDDLHETEAVVDFSGGWNGAPYQFDLAGLQGEMQVDLKGGRISSIEPGFGRLLGLIAMEQWVKRFTLDFRDIYQKGLAFNRITGKFIVSEGKGLTDDLLIDAVSARVKIIGETDLLQETLDYRVLVLPKSSDALPIAGTIVDRVASLVTQALTDDYKEGYFFGSEYKVEGTWGNAEITPLHDRDGLLKKTWTELTDFPWLSPDAN
nr:AsmA-like C-terminal region-containing protein [Methylomarinum sp. Ch1-1]MDP4522066.1 AsmA-like C-terminal region-containing protein [Methylomarinum sp. Ch1-1]